MRREEIRAVLTDRVALICTLSGEAAGEPIQGQIAVGCAIRNRVAADLGHDQKPDWWGEGYRGVCLALNQFSCWWENTPNSDRLYELAALLMARQIVDPRVTQLAWVAEGIIGGALLDLTGGADHYCTTALLKKQPPAWSRGAAQTAVIGGHTFFRLN